MKVRDLVGFDDWRHPVLLGSVMRARSNGHRIRWRNICATRRYALVLIREDPGVTTWPPPLAPIHHSGCPRVRPCSCGADAAAGAVR